MPARSSAPTLPKPAETGFPSRRSPQFSRRQSFFANEDPSLRGCTGDPGIQNRAVITAALSSFSGLFCSLAFLLGLVQICSVHGYCPGECHQSQNGDYRKDGVLLSMTVPDYKLTSLSKAAINGTLGFSNVRTRLPR